MLPLARACACVRVIHYTARHGWLGKFCSAGVENLARVSEVYSMCRIMYIVRRLGLKVYLAKVSEIISLATPPPGRRQD